MTGTIKVTDLPNAGVLDGTEIVPIVMGGVTKKATTQQIAELWPDAGIPVDANTFYAGPTTAPDAPPTFRAIVSADLPLISLATGVTGILPVANGGTNASSASITAFNNITGYTAAGATGTTSTNLVFSTSPTLVTPALGTPASGVATNLTGLPLTTGVTGTLAVANGGTGDTGTAWSTWTPTVSSDGGTVTGATISTTATYKSLGKTVWWQISCTLTAIGSGSPTGAVRFTTPGGLTPLRTYNPACSYYVNSGANAGGFISADGKAYAFKADGTTLWANGNIFTFGGTYETS